MPEDDLLTRIKSAAAAVATDLAQRSGGTQEDPSILDGVARSLATTLERWSRNPNVGRLVGSVRQDVLTGPGEPVQLVASPGPFGARGGTARFFVGEDVAAEVTVTPGEDVLATIHAPPRGLYPLRVEFRPPNGDPVPLAGQRVLQVVGTSPVALIDGDLLIAAHKNGEDAGTVVDLAREGYALAYFDVHEDNRYAEIHAAVDAMGLPQAAIITLAAREQELAALGVDFMPMFVASAVGRLRASGVPVTTIVSERHSGSPQTDQRGISVLPLRAALDRRRDDERREEKKQADRMLAAKASAEPLDWRLDRLTLSRAVPGNAFQLELDNARARARLFDALDGARSTIHIQIYILRPSRFTEELVVRLIRRARDGVVVRILVDAVYSEEQVLGRTNDALRSLRTERNVEVRAIDPIESRTDVSVSRLKKRDHRKVVVVDGARAFVSGRNASDEYYYGFDEIPVHDNSAHERIPWLDAHVELQGPLVTQVQEAFAESWLEHGGQPIARRGPAFPHLDAAGKATGRLVVHRGFADTNGLAMYEALFDDAKQHAYIVNDFPFIPAIEQAIRRMLARGVRVRILTGSAIARRADGSFFRGPTHRMLFEYMVKAKLEPLATAGAEIYEFRPAPSPLVVSRQGRIYPYVHAKLVSIDGRVATVGSANLDGTASFWETEANVVVQDAVFAGEVEAALARLIDSSSPIDVDSEAWQRERTRRAVVSTLWPDTLYS